MENDVVSHEGVVQSVQGTDVWVKMTVSSACAGCHAKAVCGAAESADKMVQARNVTGETFEVGEKVRVQLRQTIATRAVVLGYLVPTIVLLGVFCLMYLVSSNELLNVGVALAALALYYFFLWLSRKRVAKNVTFVVSKMPQI